jgi:endonuclease/exonuclease/phosphatase (EEP) superfamily protein YafD
MRRASLALRGGLGALAVLGALCALGRFSPWLDLLNHATPLFLLAALTLLIIEARHAPRRWAWLGVAAIGTICSGGLVARETLAGAAAPGETTGPTISVLTQNVWQRNPNAADLARTIIETHADVVVLEELIGSGRAVALEVSKAYPYRADCTVVSQWCSLAIFSKLPIKTWSHHEGGWRPPEWDRLGLVRATIDGGAAGDFEVIGTQLIHPDTHGAAALQASQLVAAVQDMDRKKTILAGDFNRTPWAFALRRIDQRLPISRRTHGLATWPARMPGLPDIVSPAPFLPIDQVYAGSSWRVVSLRRAPASTSDHYGVLATLAYQPR